MKYLFPGNSGSNYNDIAIWGLNMSYKHKLKLKNNAS